MERQHRGLTADGGKAFQRRVTSADLEGVSHLVVRGGGRVLAAGGHRHAMPDLAGRHEQDPVAGGAHAQRPLHVLDLEEQPAVEVADVLDHRPRHQHRGARRAPDLARGVVLADVEVAVARVPPVVHAARIEARSRVPDPVRRLEVVDHRAEGARVRPALGLLDQRAHQTRVGDRVVVEHQRVVRARIERGPQAHVVALGEAEVLPRSGSGWPRGSGRARRRRCRRSTRCRPRSR